MNVLFDILERLDAAKIHYVISRNRPDTILVSIAVIGRRVEVDVFRDGHTEVSVFSGDESSLGDEEFLDGLIRDNQD